MRETSPTRHSIHDYDESWPVSESVERFQGGIVRVSTDWVRMPRADRTETVARDRVSHPGAVAVVALDAHDQVVLIRQYRHAVGKQLWEIPAGLRDVDGEEPLRTAARELWEEAGYQAREWAVLTDCFASPGFSDERIRVYLARDLTAASAEEFDFERIHEEADMPVALLPLEEAVAAILGGRLHNSLAQVGILAAHAAARNGFAALRPADALER